MHSTLAYLKGNHNSVNSKALWLLINSRCCNASIYHLKPYIDPTYKTYFMRKLLLVSAFMALLSIGYAQNIEGVVRDDQGETVIGASVLIKGSKNGTATDFDGRFSLQHNGDFPVVLEVSYLGYQTVESEVKAPNSKLKFKLKPDKNLLEEVDLVEQRLSEKQKESALTVEAMDALAIKETPSVSFYEGLGNLKGVDLTSASIGFKVINTRGFNSTSPVRSLQIIDGVDNQSPGLNFSLGNFLGSSELDVLNVDIIAGASTAFYGPNAFNGVISMQTKNPYDFKGLTASVKVGERGLSEYAVRWADAFKNKAGRETFGYKINIYYLQADDWRAENYSSVDESNFAKVPTPAGNLGGYDAVNIYGDELDFDDGGDYLNHPGLGRFHRGGVREVDLVDYNTENLKFNTALHYRFNDDLELSYSFNYGSGTTVYQGDNRYSLKDIQFFQNRFELSKKNKFFIRAYATHEDAGNSYDGYFTALLMEESLIEDGSFEGSYRALWRQNNFEIKNLPGYPDESLPEAEFRRQMAVLVAENQELFTSYHEDIRNNLNLGFYGDSLTPGTPEFNAKFNSITSQYLNQGGSKIYDKSALYHVHGEYIFDETKIGQFRLGANGRLYTPDSRGTIFSDSAGTVITNQEFGVYGGWTKTFKERFKLNLSARVDKNQNFDYLFSPAVSFVFQQNELATWRFSVSSAVRNPTLADQYLYYNTGRAILVGNVSGYDSVVTVDEFQDFNALAPAVKANYEFDYFNIDPIKPERAQTIEAGYRNTLFNSLFVDLNYYYTWYQNFIGYDVVVKFDDAGVPRFPPLWGISNIDILRVSTNAREEVTTQGLSVGLNYYFWDKYILSGNYTWTVLNTQVTDPIVPAYNTPENKFNIGLSGRNYKIGNQAVAGFNVTYKWIQGFRFEGSPQFTGNIDSYYLLDAQVSLEQRKWNLLFKLGCSNVTNNQVYQVYGGPRVGRLAYFSILYNWSKN